MQYSFVNFVLFLLLLKLLLLLQYDVLFISFCERCSHDVIQPVNSVIASVVQRL